MKPGATWHSPAETLEPISVDENRRGHGRRRPDEDRLPRAKRRTWDRTARLIHDESIRRTDLRDDRFRRQAEDRAKIAHVGDRGDGVVGHVVEVVSVRETASLL